MTAYKSEQSYSQTQTHIPFPIVTGGIGLLLAHSLPGGLSGGQGFLIGFTVGFLVLGFIALYLDATRARETQSVMAHCPECGKELRVTIPEVQVRAVSFTTKAERGSAP